MNRRKTKIQRGLTKLLSQKKLDVRRSTFNRGSSIAGLIGGISPRKVSSARNLNSNLSLLSNDKMTLQTALHFINNDYVPSIGGETLEVTNPTTETPAGNAASAQVADVDLAVRLPLFPEEFES